MTKYKIGADEVALVLKPCSFDSKGRWTGELNTGLVVGEQNLLSPEDTEGKVLKLTRFTKTQGNA